MQGKMIYTEILMPNAPGQESYTLVQNKIAQYELHAMKHRSLSKQHYQVFVCILVNNLIWSQIVSCNARNAYTVS